MVTGYDYQAAMEIFCSKPDVRSADIRRLFHVGHSKAQELKNQAEAEMKAQGLMPFNKGDVLVDVAFKVWGIDMNVVKQRLSLKAQMERKGISFTEVKQ